MGDSPELMPLDSSLFSDHIENVARLVVYTAKLPVEKRYIFGTPGEAWRTIVTAWSQLSKERIIQDVGRFSGVLDAIIAADGTYVADKDLRNGHRRLMRRLVRGGVPVGGGQCSYCSSSGERVGGAEEVLGGNDG